METGRPCPDCASRMGFWDMFVPGWLDTLSCPHCGRSDRFRPTLGRRLLKAALCTPVVLGAYYASRPLQEPWAFIVFFLLLLLGAPVLLLLRLHWTRHAELVPLDRGTPPAGTTKPL